MPVEVKILSALGIAKAGTVNGLRYYQVLGTDSNGNTCMAMFGVKLCYEDSADKTFSRMHPIEAPKDEEEVKDE